MSMDSNKKYKYNIKVKSKIHKCIYHAITIDLYCYERMPDENVISNTKIGKRGKNKENE